MFRRRTTSSSDSSDDGTADVAPGGKGRATPTRKEAEAARKQRLAAPRTRKEQQAARKAQVAQSRARQRQALSTGDDTYLPARDKGPVKRFVRDFVDSQWHVGEILVPLFFGVFVILALAPASISALGVYVWLALLVLMGADGVRVVRGVKAGIRQRFGEADTQGVAMYAVLRALQMRRLRLPKPLVKHGQSF
jgi:Flp pilus assembly protein TadB